MTTTITMHKGGTGERVFDLRDERVPDLWHAIQRARKSDQALFLHVWYMAHAMRDHIIAEANPETIATAELPSQHSVVWIRTEIEGRTHHNIQYGQQVTGYTDWLAALTEFNQCVDHAARCAGFYDHLED